MPALPTSPFLFTVCQVGAEPALKEEMARIRPDLRFAYSRPGFVTFKNPAREFEPGFPLDSVFARAYGMSSGKARGQDATRIADYARDLHSRFGRKLRFHCWERDQYFPGDEPPRFVRGEWARAAQAALESVVPAGAEFDALFERDPNPRNGDLVFDLIAVEPDEFWYGSHLHGHEHASAPGGRYRVDLPPGAPSRAYIKLEEALRWSRAPIQAGDIAVEIGSAPGGASFALLERGLQVIGIDPAEMAPQVLSHPKYRHVPKSFIHVIPQDVPRSVQWLLLDMNSDPTVALAAADRVGGMFRDSLLGVILTLKLNDWSLAQDIPAMLEHVRTVAGTAGMSKLRATQLASNRQEIVVVALTRKGALRPAA